MWPDGSLLTFRGIRTVGVRTMAEPPFVILLVAPDEADRRLIGGLLGEQHDVHWVTGVSSALAAVVEHPHDAVLLDASMADETTLRPLLEEDPGGQVIVLGDPAAPPPSRPRARPAPSTTCRRPRSTPTRSSAPSA